MSGYHEDPAAVQRFIRAPDGPVARHMMIVGEAVRVEARSRLKAGFPREFLGPTIVKRMIRTDHGIAVRIGSDKVVTRPHIIRGNPTLAFGWPKGEAMGIGKSPFHFALVHHPGSNFEKYLTKILTEALELVAKGSLL